MAALLAGWPPRRSGSCAAADRRRATCTGWLPLGTHEHPRPQDRPPRRHPRHPRRDHRRPPRPGRQRRLQVRPHPAVRQARAAPRDATPRAASPSSACRATSSAARSPASAEEIAEFCSATYGVTFPMTEKVDVNGEQPAPALRRAHRWCRAPAATPVDVTWNFEKFVVDADGTPGRPLRAPAPSPTTRRSSRRSSTSCRSERPGPVSSRHLAYVGRAGHAAEPAARPAAVAGRPVLVAAHPAARRRQRRRLRRRVVRLRPRGAGPLPARPADLDRRVVRLARPDDRQRLHPRRGPLGHHERSPTTSPSSRRSPRAGGCSATTAASPTGTAPAARSTTAPSTSPRPPPRSTRR